MSYYVTHSTYVGKWILKFILSPGGKEGSAEFLGACKTCIWWNHVIAAAWLVQFYPMMQYLNSRENKLSFNIPMNGHTF